MISVVDIIAILQASNEALNVSFTITNSCINANRLGHCGASVNTTAARYTDYAPCKQTICADGAAYCGGNQPTSGNAELIYYAPPSSFAYGYTNRGTGTPQVVTGSGNLYTYQGCFESLGPVTPPRIVYDLNPAGGSNSVSSCATYCGSHGNSTGTAYTYMALDRGGFCGCGTSIDQRSQLLPPTDCASPCSGDASQICGGPLTSDGYRGVVSLYALSGTTAPTTASKRDLHMSELLLDDEFLKMAEMDAADVYGL